MNKFINFLEGLFGPSWRTSFWGLLTVASITIVTNPNLVAFLPQAMQTYIVGLASLIAATTGSATVLNIKDKQVTGGTVPANKEAKERVDHVK